MSKHSTYRVKEFNGTFTIQVEILGSQPGFPLPVPSESWEDADIKGGHYLGAPLCEDFDCLQDAYDRIIEFKEGPIYHSV